MNSKKVVGTVIGIGTFIGGALLLKNHKSNSVPVHKVTAQIIEEPEILFAGISLEKLNELAKQIHHGLNCTIDQWGFLVFNHKSNRGHQTFHTQMSINDAGKLINLGGHYPGQWWSNADEFAKRANELFKFKK